MLKEGPAQSQSAKNGEDGCSSLQLLSFKEISVQTLVSMPDEQKSLQKEFRTVAKQTILASNSNKKASSRERGGTDA